MEEFTKMVDYYMDHGFNYYDTSYAYHNGKSEGAFKEAVTDRYPRESFRIIDKLPTWALTCEEDNQKYLDEMMERLGVDYFDKLFIHNINEAWWPLAEKAKTFIGSGGPQAESNSVRECRRDVLPHVLQPQLL